MILRNKILSGQFVNLRPIMQSDSALTLSWRISHRARWLNSGAQTEDAQAKWISSRPDTEFNFIIELCDNNIPVGMLSLIDIDFFHRRAEPARFLIGNEKAVEGIPVAAEAEKLLFELAFNELNLLRLYGTVANINTKMIKWNEFLGWKNEGCLRKHLFLGDKFYDAICMGLLVDEYKKITVPRFRLLLQIPKHT